MRRAPCPTRPSEAGCFPVVKGRGRPAGDRADSSGTDPIAVVSATGVGGYTVQIAGSLGAHVIATVRGDVDEARGLGATLRFSSPGAAPSRRFTRQTKSGAHRGPAASLLRAGGCGDRAGSGKCAGLEHPGAERSDQGDCGAWVGDPERPSGLALPEARSCVYRTTYAGSSGSEQLNHHPAIGNPR